MKDESYRTQLKKCIVGVIGFFLYFVMSYMAALPAALVGKDFNTFPVNVKQIYLIIYNIFTMFLFFYLYKKILIKDWKEFKTKYKEYFSKYIKYWLIAIAVMYVSNICIVLLKYKLTGSIGIASNEQTVRETLIKAPFYTFFSAVIYAPFIEELTFRKSFKNIFHNKYLFIIISAFVFGGMHVFTPGMTWFDLLYLIPYCAPGVAFAVILTKTDNIFSTISLHFCHNFILMLLQLILMLRGVL